MSPFVHDVTAQYVAAALFAVTTIAAGGLRALWRRGSRGSTPVQADRTGDRSVTAELPGIEAELIRKRRLRVDRMSRHEDDITGIKRKRPEAGFDREQAWRSLQEPQGSGDPDRLLKPPEIRGSSPRLMSIARAYDRICRQADGLCNRKLPKRALVGPARDPDAAGEARHRRAAANESGAVRVQEGHLAADRRRFGDERRQSAERRFLQLSRPHLRSDSPTPRTQNERVEQNGNDAAGVRNGSGRWNMHRSSVEPHGSWRPSTTSRSGSTGRPRPGS